MAEVPIFVFEMRFHTASGFTIPYGYALSVGMTFI